MRVNLNPAALAELEMFFAEHNNVNENNFSLLFNEWRESERGQKANAFIDRVLNYDIDSKIQHGLTSIEKGNFSYVNKTRGNYCGSSVVYDNITRLRGLIAENGEEILPCIFDSVSVRLGGFIEVRFKSTDYSFSFAACDYEPEKGWFCYGENSAYMFSDDYRLRKSPSPTFLQLEDLLKIRHRK